MPRSKSRSRSRSRSRTREHGKCAKCCNKFNVVILRILNLVIAIVGLAFVGYGLYLVFQASPAAITVLSGTVLGLGVIVFLLSSCLAACGYKRRWFIKCYMFCFGVLMIGEAMMAIYFLLPSARAKIVASLGAEKVKATVEAHILVAGYCVLGIVAIQIASMVFAACQRSWLSPDDLDSDSDVEDGRRRLMKDGIEVGDVPETAEQKYRKKNAYYYEKYGISRD